MPCARPLFLGLSKGMKKITGANLINWYTDTQEEGMIYALSLNAITNGYRMVAVGAAVEQVCLGSQTRSGYQNSALVAVQNLWAVVAGMASYRL